MQDISKYHIKAQNIFNVGYIQCHITRLYPEFNYSCCTDATKSIYLKENCQHLITHHLIEKRNDKPHRFDQSVDPKTYKSQVTLLVDKIMINQIIVSSFR